MMFLFQFYKNLMNNKNSTTRVQLSSAPTLIELKQIPKMETLAKPAKPQFMLKINTGP